MEMVKPLVGYSYENIIMIFILLALIVFGIRFILKKFKNNK